MRWTGAGERTVKNWLAGVSGPNGQHLVELIRNSDEVLDILLLLAGRQQVAAAKNLVDVRNNLAQTIQQVDELMGDTFRRERWALLDISNKCARDPHGGR